MTYRCIRCGYELDRIPNYALHGVYDLCCLGEKKYGPFVCIAEDDEPGDKGIVDWLMDRDEICRRFADEKRYRIKATKPKNQGMYVRTDLKYDGIFMLLLLCELLFPFFLMLVDRLIGEE